MSALACKLKSNMVSKMSSLYNQELYFIKDCNKFESKYTLPNIISDLQLKIYFEEHNKIVMAGKLVNYCSKDSTKKKIKLKDINKDLNQPEINIIENYITQEDTWDKIDW